MAVTQDCEEYGGIPADVTHLSANAFALCRSLELDEEEEAKMNHNIKIAPRYYDDVESGRKPFECRRNDRNYQVGDTLTLQEWLPGVEYTGREIVRVVTYVLPGGVFGIAEGYCVMGLADAWVPVTENLPDKGLLVLLFLDNRSGQQIITTGKIYESKDDEYDGEFCIGLDATNPDFLIRRFVTHWMPLPEPPKNLRKFERVEL